MVGYTPDYSQWTAAANVSNGSVVWPEPTYDKWLMAVMTMDYTKPVDPKG